MITLERNEEGQMEMVARDTIACSIVGVMEGHDDIVHINMHAELGILSFEELFENKEALDNEIESHIELLSWLLEQRHTWGNAYD